MGEPYTETPTRQGSVRCPDCGETQFVDFKMTSEVTNPDGVREQTWTGRIPPCPNKEPDMISVDHLIETLTALNIDHQEVRVWVQVDVDGKPHRLPLGSTSFGLGGLSLVLVGEPEPVPDPVIAPLGEGESEHHEHRWFRDDMAQQWRCTVPGSCVATVTFEQIMEHPIPQTEEEGFALLNHLAR